MAFDGIEMYYLQFYLKLRCNLPISHLNDRHEVQDTASTNLSEDVDWINETVDNLTDTVGRKRTDSAILLHINTSDLSGYAFLCP